MRLLQILLLKLISGEKLPVSFQAATIAECQPRSVLNIVKVKSLVVAV